MHQAEISGRYYDKNINIHRSFPSSWQEMTEKHLDQLAEVLVSGEPEDKHSVMILYRWLNIPDKIFSNLDQFYIEQLTEQLAFLFQQNTLNKVLVPEIVHHNVTYIGPRDGFLNGSFLEWIIAENYFKKYQQTKADSDLNCIVYAIYRPKRDKFSENDPDYKGDLRELINDETIEKKSEVFFDLSKKEKMKALITYIGNRNTVMQRFQPVFEDVERKGISDPYAWSGILVDMTGSKWQTRELVEREKVYNIFIHWHQNILRMEEWEMELENSKR